MAAKVKSLFVMVLCVLGALAVLQPAAMADPLKMTLVGTNQGWSMGGVYVSPYQIQIGDDSKNVFGLACDDYTTEIYFNTPWYANEYTLADVTSDSNHVQKFPENSDSAPKAGDVTVFFPGDSATHDYTPTQAYTAAAFLVRELMYNTSVNGNPEATGEYSYAIWQIFDPLAYKGWGTTPLTDTEVTQVDAAMDWAFGQAASGLGYTLDIYTPCGATAAACSSSPNPGVAQEFLALRAPEGSSVAILAFDFLALCGVVFLVRKRVVRNAAKPVSRG